MPKWQRISRTTGTVFNGYVNHEVLWKAPFTNKFDELKFYLITVSPPLMFYECMTRTRGNAAQQMAGVRDGYQGTIPDITKSIGSTGANVAMVTPAT